ncbi:MAG: adenylate/guanylate cyclase domain-containing protein, partial [Burkholderiales bacterium]|nr:adenylate/guanylate cyclase domain-containing protein [Burkholderiales bacterium]
MSQAHEAIGGAPAARSAAGGALARLLVRSAEFAEPFMATAALIGLVGHPLFYLIWSAVFPQPYENLALRIVGGAICLPLVLKARWPDALKRWLPLYWHAVVTFQIPFFFTLLMLLNGYALPWVLTFVGGAFLLTFFVHWRLAIAMFVIGTGAAFGAYGLFAPYAFPALPPYEIFVVYLFVLGVGSAINRKLQASREAEAALERRLRAMSGQNATIMRERNKLLGHFLNNTVVARLRRYESELGLDAALTQMTRQEKRYCAMMQADIRNFTRMFSGQNELEIARLVAQCFSEITTVGQDLSVIKPVGDCIFLYSDVEQDHADAVLNVLALACVFVESVGRVNRTLRRSGAAPLNFGVAVHAGNVVYGNLASDTLIDPTVIGVNVNRTARLEELTKSPTVRERVGANAVILSEEFVWQLRKAGLSLPDLITLDLPALNVTLRDFPEVERVHALRYEAALALSAWARERIRAARLGRAPRMQQAEYSRHRDVEYYTEMYGSGPNVVWSMFVNVSPYPLERVREILRRHFGHLRCTVSPGAERWLALSTENAPGAYDETDVEAWIIELIERLSAPGEGGLR